jgi:hypothetical protein
LSPTELPLREEGSVPMAESTLAWNLVSVWKQSLVDGASVVDLEGRRYAVESSRNKGLKMVRFRFREVEIEGIEQNPQTRSRWAQLAQEGKRIMQFKSQGRYIGNVCDGKLLSYPAWKSLGLPE